MAVVQQANVAVVEEANMAVMENDFAADVKRVEQGEESDLDSVHDQSF